ncbi:hypothetical protein LNP74_10560 [Klebsiella pneumoniae subsp. pneumoniae]|nr:hypothetical protein [Klebsiella pneumoniae subsp. pneumoniae]
MGLSNYWGYNPLAWFALDPRYASDPDRAPWMSFAMRLGVPHAAGIEVILDIVLNHSAEIDLERAHRLPARNRQIVAIG